VTVVEFIDGAGIRIYGGNEEIGDGGGPLIQLTRPIIDGETITVVQELNGCESVWVQVVDVDCAEQTGGDAQACSADWPAFQHSVVRDANQNHPGTLADPYRVKSLPTAFSAIPASNRWQFTPPVSGGFRAAPMVFNGRVYIGSGGGFLYALDAATGTLDWQYPSAGDPPLTSNFTCNSSSFGIASSAAYARIKNEVDAVIFGAPDKSIGDGEGSGRLFALNAQTGAVIWKSPEIAVLEGSGGSRHEQIGYSSPLVLGRTVYIGIANHCDNPIQNGRVIAVDRDTGNIVGGFSFKATGTRGGGIWSSVGAGFGAIYATTGNVASGNSSEPTPNHGLSFLRLNANTGAIDWKLQPVPFEQDGDPDWASGTTTVNASCGELVVSTMKDGWTYAVRAAPPLDVVWQYPNTGWPFPVATLTVHGDTRYHRAGAAWNDIFFTTMGGADVLNKDDQDQVIGGYTRLHALNICTGPRLRWLLDVPGTASSIVRTATYLSPPSVAGGIVYIGTHQNHLVAVADTSVWPSTSSSCAHSGFDNAACTAAGFALVPKPKVLANVELPGGGGILNEPVLAGGRIYVATTGGHVFMVEP
jgi:outer membrane protein assembly factor BamB